MKRLFCLLALTLAVTVGGTWAAGADQGDEIVGRWLTEGGKATVEVSKDGDAYVGKIVKLGEPTYPADDPMAGKPKTDRKNPDESLRDRRVEGITILSRMKAAGDGKWEDGRIYDAESGKTYKAKAELNDEGGLDMRGYIGFSLIGRTTTWTRAPEPAMDSDMEEAENMEKDMDADSTDADSMDAEGDRNEGNDGGGR